MTDAALVGTVSIWVLILSPGAQGNKRFEVGRTFYEHFKAG